MADLPTFRVPGADEIASHRVDADLIRATEAELLAIGYAALGDVIETPPHAVGTPWAVTRVLLGDAGGAVAAVEVGIAPAGLMGLLGGKPKVARCLTIASELSDGSYLVTRKTDLPLASGVIGSADVVTLKWRTVTSEVTELQRRRLADFAERGKTPVVCRTLNDAAALRARLAAALAG